MFDHWSEGDRSFNSRPHKEVDLMQALPDVPSMHTFNSRPHKEVDVSHGYYNVETENLSIHDLTRRSTLKTYQKITEMLFQFTTSQGGRPS